MVVMAVVSDGGSASRDESGRGSIQGPEAPDDVRMSNEMSYANTSVALARHVAMHDAHGYDQGERDGDGTTEKVHVGYKDFEMHGGDYDCTSLVGEIAYAQGLMSDGEAHSLYTGNAEELLGDAGYTKMPYDESKVQPGDVLLRYSDPSREDGHAAIASGNGMQIDASHGDGPGGVTGKQGDQDKTEVLERPLQDNWQVIMRPPKGTHFDKGEYERSSEAAANAERSADEGSQKKPLAEAVRESTGQAVYKSASSVAFMRGVAGGGQGEDVGDDFAAGLYEEESRTAEMGREASVANESLVRDVEAMQASGGRDDFANFER